MKNLFITLLVIVVSFSTSTFGQTTADANKAMSEKMYGDVVRISQPLAEQGDAVAQLQMGMLFLNGWGVGKDYARAFKWLQMSANSDNKDAQYALGSMYLRGQGVRFDLNQSFFWRKKAADNRQTYAAFDVAEMYMNGLGVEKDTSEAKRYYEMFLIKPFVNPSQTIVERVATARAKIIEISASNEAVRGSSSSVSVDKAAQRYSTPSSAVPIAPLSTSVGNQQTVQQVKALASTGDTNAQVQLGNMYDSGQGVKQNYVEAVKWYRAAANKGDANGRFMLGAMYDAGRGVKQSYAEALKWYRLAADQGNPLAQHRLGVMYSEGVGVGQSSTEALKWMQRAAEHGNGDSQVAIGEMYSLGKGVLQNFSEAATWYRMAASKGNPNAQYALGGLYRNGRGVVQDDNEAIKWYQMAAAKGDARSIAALDSLRVDMAARQRVLDLQQRIAREQDARRQQAEESRRQAEQIQQEQQQQQQEQDRARLEKQKCLENATERLCRIGCMGARGNDVYTCPQNCAERERANVAACNGIFIPPVQQIIIQQGGGDPNPFPNVNKCIKDGGTLMCR